MAYIQNKLALELFIIQLQSCKMQVRSRNTLNMG